MVIRFLNFLYQKNAWLNASCNFTLLDIASVIISGAALIFAILIPVRIANKQNKIALFEKRFAAYSDFLKIRTLSVILNDDAFSFSSFTVTPESPQVKIDLERDHKVRNSILWQFSTVVKTLSGGKQNHLEEVFTILSEMEMSVHSLQFLYSKKLKKIADLEVINKDIEKIFDSLGTFMCDVCLNKPVNDQDRLDFVERTEKFYNKYADFFEKHLSI